MYRPRQLIESGDTSFPDLHTSQLWQSTYQATIIKSATGLANPSAPLKAQIPPSNANDRVKVVTTDLGKSVNTSAYGVYGSNPRTRCDPLSTTIAAERSDLTCGTTRGTGYIPGYQGHIPINSRNPYKARYEQSLGRSETDKSNICQNFKRNLLGYGGYQFLNPLNDKGPVQISSATTYGEANSIKNWTM